MFSEGAQGHISVTCACEVNLMGLPLSENGVFRGEDEQNLPPKQVTSW